MKKLWLFFIFVLITLFSFENIQAKYCDCEMRASWMHYNVYGDTEEHRQEYMERMDSLNINTIYLSAPIMFSEKPEYFDDIIHDLDSAGYNIYLGWFWHNTSYQGFEDLANEEDYIYQPLNMTNTQHSTAINATTYNYRGITAELDKNNYVFINKSVDEAKKYFDEYEELDGIVLDYIRMDERIGSGHDSAKVYLEANTDLEMDVLKTSIFGEMPIPSKMITANYGTSLDGGIALAFHNHNDSPDSTDLAITVMNHSNDGYCLTFHWKTGVFEIPIVNNIFNQYIDSIGYTGDTLYCWEYEDDNNTFTTSPDGIERAREWAYSVDLIPKSITDTSQVPDGAPIILGLPWTMSNTVAGALKGHCETGGLVMLLRGAASTAGGGSSAYTDLTGYTGNDLIAPENDTYPEGISIAITDDGVSMNMPHNERAIGTDTTYVNEWFDWNCNEMIGKTGQRMKDMFIENYGIEKYVIVSVWNGINKYNQQQDWITWDDSSWFDIMNQMVYTSNIENFKEYLSDTDLLLNDFNNTYIPCIAINTNTTGLQDSNDVVDQTIYALDSIDILGYSYFGGSTGFLTNFSVPYCDFIGDSIKNSIVDTMPSGLVAYWKFSNSPSYMSGNTFKDLSGNNHTLTPLDDNLFQLSQNGVDSARIFDGDNCALTILDHEDFNILSGPKTFIIWAYNTVIDNSEPYDDQVLFSKRYSINNDNRYFYEIESTNYSRFYASVEGLSRGNYFPSFEGTYANDFNTSANSWYMYSLVVDSNADSISLYINSRFICKVDLINAGCLYTTNSNNNFYVGAYGTSTWEWNGAISSFKIYNDEFTHNQIITEFETTNGHQINKETEFHLENIKTKVKNENKNINKEPEYDSESIKTKTR